MNTFLHANKRKQQQQQKKNQTAPRMTTILGAALEVLIHEILYQRSLYPHDAFSPHRYNGISCHACRHPDVVSYIYDTLIVAIPAICTGVADELMLVIYDSAYSPDGDANNDGDGGEQDDNDGDDEYSSNPHGQNRTQSSTQSIVMERVLERYSFAFQIDLDDSDSEKDDNETNNGTEQSYNNDNNNDNNNPKCLKALEDNPYIPRSKQDAILTHRVEELERSLRDVMLKLISMDRVYYGKRRSEINPKFTGSTTFKLCLHTPKAPCTTTAAIAGKSSEQQQRQQQQQQQNRQGNTSARDFFLNANEDDEHDDDEPMKDLKSGQNSNTTTTTTTTPTTNGISIDKCPELSEAIQEGTWYSPDVQSCSFPKAKENTSNENDIRQSCLFETSHAKSTNNSHDNATNDNPQKNVKDVYAESNHTLDEELEEDDDEVEEQQEQDWLSCSTTVRPVKSMHVPSCGLRMQLLMELEQKDDDK